MLTPFFCVFLAAHEEVNNVISCDVGSLDPSILEEMEADSYWHVP